MKRNNFKVVDGLFLVAVIAFFYLPIISLMIFSFNSDNSLTHFKSFSFKWYLELFKNEEITNAVIMTFIIAILATIISTFIGTFASIALAKYKKRLRNTVLTLNNIPIVNPEIVTAIGMLLLFQSLKIEKGYFTMLLAHIAFCLPYVIISVYPKVRSLDPNLVEAAMDLGAPPLKALRHAILPQIKVAVVAALAISFTMSFDDFVISYFTSGSATNISIYLYTLKRGVNPSINALSTLMIIVITIVVIVHYLRTNKQIKKGVKFNEKSI
ncbi:MAG: ABC transporter permease [Acholeplasmatales bacterium]|jgi:spermidine/putrescine transport system permease protein|nr:ABC transporter permease [Acholeplasmataceae bacterium]MCK9289754.1 ABC transporter permease [Acholeplasmataceae bacterium]MCK9428025.1 ABC transporter permease [Acholeplasmataceae bacterium]MDY0115726.1 ABC transporter permease [Acholeplasmatales bacterium]HHT39747.1 ABC transporter permease [Acholeplasmataceae bacterium]